MRRTAKYAAALDFYREQGGLDEPLHDALYRLLEAANHHWEPSSGTWEPGKPEPTSMFGDEEDPTGVIRIRIMAHPKDIDDGVRKVCAAVRQLGWRVDEVSDPYDNRRGIGKRVYVTAIKPEG